MQKLLSLLFILFCIGIGYIMSGGNLKAFLQPGEFIIIIGCCLGSFMMSNSKYVIKLTFDQLKQTFKSNKDALLYRQLLTLLYELLVLIQNDGLKGLDQHVENPKESTVFQKYPLILKDESIVSFICDNFRIMTMGNVKPQEMDVLLSQEINSVDEQLQSGALALHKVADSLPGFGICVAVSGIVIAMQSLGESVITLGFRIAGALVGTFFGVLFCYALFEPLSNSISQQSRKKLSLYECIKIVIVNHMAGKSPILSVDAGRKLLPLDYKPNFNTLESWIEEQGAL